MQRREFLNKLAYGFVLASLRQQAFAFGDSPFGARYSGDYLVWGAGTTINRINLKNLKSDSQFIGASCHGFLSSKKEPHHVITIEKWRPRMVKVDFLNPQKTFKKFSGEFRRFYGHGCVLPDEENFVAISVDNDSKITYLEYRNMKTLMKFDEIQIGRGGAHEIGILPDKRHLVIAMTGWIPRAKYNFTTPAEFDREDFSKLIYFNLEKRQVVDEQYLLDSRLSLAHLKVTPDGRVYAISDIMHNGINRWGAGGVHVSQLYGKMENLHIPEVEYRSLIGEFLSIEFNPAKELLAVTNPYGSRILIFDTVKNQFQSSFLSNSSGISWSANGETLFYFNRKGHDGTAPAITSSSLLKFGSFNASQFTDQLMMGASSHMSLFRT